MENNRHGMDLAKEQLKVTECPLLSAFTRIESQMFNVDELGNIIKSWLKKYMHNKGSIVIWTYAEITWGIWNGEEICTSGDCVNFKDILELRAFNEQEELHLVREDNVLEGRYVEDGIGSNTYYVDSFARLFGERDMQADIPQGFVRLSDPKRKLEMDVVCDEDLVGVQYLGLETRNYVGADEKTGLSGYVDYRFIAVRPAQGGHRNG